MDYFKILEDESTDDWLVVDGYLFLFGGKDETGEYFTQKTDSDSSYTKTIGRLAIDLEHSIKFTEDYPGNMAFGYVDAKTIRDDKYGRLARHLFDRRNEYVTNVFEPMIREKILASSTEAEPDEIIIKDAKTGEIKKWPLKKQALTVSPAEKRLMSDHQMQIVKSLSEKYPTFVKSLLGEGITSADNGGGNIQNGDNAMNEEEIKALIDNTVKAALSTQEKPDYDAIAAKAGEKAAETVKAYISELDKTPQPKKGGVVVVEDEADKAVKSFKPEYRLGLQLQAVRHLAMNEPGQLNEHQKAILGQNTSVPSEGGFLIGTEEETMLEKKMHDMAVFASRTNNRTISQGANSASFYGVKENSRASGSRFGGVVGYRVAEGQTITASSMKFYKYNLKPEKYAALVYATNEVVRDANLLGQEIAEAAPAELAFLVDDDILNGTSAGYPSGILSANCLVTVAKEAGQAATTLVSQNIIKMWARLYSRSKANAVWFINQDVTPQLHQLNLPVGTGGALVYMPPGGLSGAPYGTLYGRPVIETEFNATLGTVGDIVLADMSQYRLANMGSVRSASSMHVQFLTDQMVYRFTVEYDGQATWEAALTPYKGSNTVSPFVALATRS